MIADLQGRMSCDALVLLLSHSNTPASHSHPPSRDDRRQVLGQRVGRSQRWAIRSTALLILVTMIATLCALFKGEAIAIPAFSRKYNMACNNCHVAGFPKLNDFGNRFRDQGYNMNSDEDDPSYVLHSLGTSDDFWKSRHVRRHRGGALMPRTATHSHCRSRLDRQLAKEELL